MNEKKNIFRQKSLEKVSSPEQMNDYIKTAGPSVWLVLAAIIIMLTGFIIWSVFGTATLTDAKGEVKELHPYTLVTN